MIELENTINDELAFDELAQKKQSVLQELKEKTEDLLEWEEIDLHTIENVLEQGESSIEEEKVKTMTEEEYYDLPVVELKTKNIIAKPTEDEMIDLCPFLVDVKIKSRYQKYIDLYFNEEPEEIKDINFDEVKERFLCGYITEKNLRDIFETSSSKWKWQNYIDDLKKNMKHPDLTAFLNFQIIDESDVVIATVNRVIFPTYKKMIFEAPSNKVFLFFWNNTDNFIKILVREVIWFDELIEKYKKFEDLTPKEYYLLKKEHRAGYKKIMVPNPDWKWKQKVMYTSSESNMMREINQAIFESENEQEETPDSIHPYVTKILS